MNPLNLFGQQPKYLGPEDASPTPTGITVYQAPVTCEPSAPVPPTPRSGPGKDWTHVWIRMPGVFEVSASLAPLTASSAYPALERLAARVLRGLECAAQEDLAAYADAR